MTEEESFLLVNLKEDKAKKLAQVISNDSCRKILDFLTHTKEATESEIAKELKLAISTVHYNLQHLYKNGLVIVDEYHYSKKGKEVNHYKLAKKFIIIAPTETKGLMSKLKDILPLGIFAVVAASSIQVYIYLSQHNFFSRGMEESTLVVNDFVAKSAGTMAMEAEAYTAPINIASQTIKEPNIALWFLLGATSVIVFFIFLKLLKKQKNR